MRYVKEEFHLKKLLRRRMRYVKKEFHLKKLLSMRELQMYAYTYLFKLYGNVNLCPQDLS